MHGHRRDDAQAGRARQLASETTVAVLPWGIEGAASAAGVLASDATVELELDAAYPAAK